ncbi:MAG: D-tyrosyl-tRNA(Tyr) deacylase [Williamsia herbipolensis]|uniref:D-aminoacyl-tRNA deacylase n=1 Tax=Williamsia serinedens TaxID=391736 RepID=A0ABT1H295_9NOCA|nr:D-aminoacyl-tRNA deacylase [Williamsia serinedens]MBE7163527.1 D-tyrosyl-tRNA(Tyr) deacylase [Williamsia herbipolensis]MCP2161342.1 D-tyrosyl-tRNA(Tyr) deacylase [Williamsia serinedens]
MKAVVTRVTAAHVEVDGETVGQLDLDDGAQGLLVLLGATHDDTEDTVRRMADKIWTLRILDDETSAADRGAPVLVVSQFTLYGDVRKGRRPSWNAAAPGDVAEPLVDRFVTALSDLGATVATGRFGAHMRVHSVNDGPVTILIEM